MSKADHCNVAIRPCGHIQACAADKPQYADEIASWTREGYTVERMTYAEFRADPRPFGCPEGCDGREKA